MEPVSGKEIKEAVFDIPDNKSPGPDGYTSRFYKDAWPVIGHSVIQAVQDFFLHKQLLKQINATNLIMIPKCANPSNVSQFRPIACCNVLYKIISKILCSRLARVLPQLVDHNQGAFIKDRNIQENILICQDLIKMYEKPNSSPKCLLKVDMQKAYDTIEWGFVNQHLSMLQFPTAFQTLLMECITTASYSISVNGETFGFFKGHRGLRQGDPLSPLLFTLCMDYMTRILKYAAANYHFTFHPLCKKMQLASLMFADDILLFCKGEAESIMILLKAYTLFSNTSGLKANTTKSEAYFGGVPEDLKTDILRVSGFSEGTLPFTYLGMPIQTTRLKRRDCECLIEKVCSRIHSVNSRQLSYADRFVLIRAVFSTLHSYWASAFIIPKMVITRIEAICRNYLWDSSTEYRKPPLIAWDTVCRTRKEGGLGVKCLETSNHALIGKLVSWIFEGRDSIWVKWVNTNHLRGKDWAAYSPTPYSSWAWRRICSVKNRLLSNFPNGQWNGTSRGYSTSSAYEWMRGRLPPVSWHEVIWNTWVLPRHQFLGWTYAQGGLRTRDKLVHMGLITDDACSLCGQTNETADHLFFTCTYSSKALAEIAAITTIQIPNQNALQWCSNNNGSSVQQGIKAAITMAILYNIWMQRNRGRIEHSLIHPQKLAVITVREVKTRVESLDYTRLDRNDKEWLVSKNLMYSLM
ncbi:hypothetical protein vseg_015186 [Gypsophila vaccaria]